MTEALQEAGLWIYKMFITFIIAVVVIGIVAVTAKSEPNTILVQKDLLIARILYSPDSFWYQDRHGTTYPGVVDEQKFTQEQMNKNFKYPAGYGGASIALVKNGQTKTVFVNEQTFANIKMQVQRKVADTGSLETHRYPVTIRSNGREERGYIIMEVAMPKKT